MKRTKSQGLGFGQTNAGASERTPAIRDLVDLLDIPKKFTQIRLIGGVLPYVQHWVPIKNKAGQEVKIPKVSPSFDPFTDSYDSTIEDPYKELEGVQTSKHYYVNCIVRDLQDQEPRKKEKPSKAERKSGIIEKGSTTWNPVRVLRIPSGVAKQFQQLIQMNRHKIKGKTQYCELSDPDYGCDIFINFDPEAPGATKYMVQKGDHSPLTKAEKEYLLYNLDFTETAMKSESEEKAKQEAKALRSKQEGIEFEDEDDDDVDLSESKRKKRKKRKDKSKTKDKAKSKDKAKRKKRKSI